MRFLFSFLKRHLLSLGIAALCLLTLFGWWQSSRYSERHLFYFNRLTVEVFSSNSLVRLSFVNGEVGQFGSRTFYKHPNARGKFMIRPLVPSLAKRPDMIDLTFGYWHLFILAVTGLGTALAREWRSGTKINAEGSTCDDKG